MSGKLPLLLLSVIFLSSSLALASDVTVPRTGDTVSHTAGDDGNIQAGVPWPSPRFIDNANGTITDNLTGLTWLKNPYCTDTIGGIDISSNPTWANALIWSSNLASGACGLSDGSVAGNWRLPNIKELKSLMDMSRQYPAQSSALPESEPFLSGRLPTTCWSSSTEDTNAATAWVIDLGTSDSTAVTKLSNQCVWPVRTTSSVAPAQIPQTGQVTSFAPNDDAAIAPGVPWPTPRFTNNGNGTITDNLSGLIWLKNAHCTQAAGTVERGYGKVTQEIALAWSNSLANGYCGLSDGSIPGDWRLPNRLELESLVQMEQKYTPEASRDWVVLPAGHPFSLVMYGNYWSSTGNWQVGIGFYGFLNNTSTTGYLLPVRGGHFGNPTISVAPQEKDYGRVPVAGSASHTVTLSNMATAGSSRLHINTIGLKGPDSGLFSLDVGDGSSGTCGRLTPILAPGDSCTVNVNFNPTSPGTKSATLRISSSDVNSQNIDIPLTGTAVYYTVTGSIRSGDGTISPANPVTVSKGETVSLTLTPFANFDISSTVAGTCAPGSWNGNIYTTGKIDNDCTLEFSFIKITYPLNLTCQGTGNGIISATPNPPLADCTGYCSQPVDSSTAVTLVATATGSSVFSGWSGCPAVTANRCTLTMSEAKTVSAFFNLPTGNNVRVGIELFGTISSGFATIGDSSELSIKGGDYYESLIFDRPVSFRLRGGYSDTFLSVTGSSVIHGPVLISDGTLEIENIVMQ